MNISDEDRRRWQQWGTTQQDATKAGTIFGPLSGASDLQKIAFEQQQALFRQMGTQTAGDAQLLSQGGIYGGGGAGTASPVRRAFFRVVKIILVVPIAAGLLVIGAGIATAPDTTNVDRKALVDGSPDPSFYAMTDLGVQKLSHQKASQLLEKHFQKLPEERFEELSPQKQAVVQALWSRYLKEPKEFLSLSDHQQYISRLLFDMYLLDLGEKSGSAQPYIDRGRLYLTSLDPVHIAYNAHEQWATYRWFDGVLALPENAELYSLANAGRWDARLHRSFLRGKMVLKGMVGLK